MKKHSILVDLGLVAVLGMAVAVPSFAIVSAPVLGAAAGYPVLDASTANAQAKADAQNAYNQLLSMSCTTDMTGVDMNNQRLAPGTYCFNTGTVLNGQVLLDGKGDSNAVFVFRMNTRFDAWPNATVVLLGGARAENVFWQVGGPVILGTNAQFAGTVVSMNSITVGGGTNSSVFDDKGTVNGRLWSVGSTVSVPARTVVGFVQPIVIVPVSYQPQYAQYQEPYPQYAPQQGTGTSYLTVSANDGNFTLFVNGMRVNNGQRYAMAPGAYIVTEINMSGVNYGEPTFTGACAQNGISGALVLNAGADATCVVVNHPLAGWMNPGMPNTGFGGSALPMLNMLGLLIVTAFVWQEASYEKASS